MGDEDDLGPVAFGEMCQCRQIVGEHRLEWVARLPLRMLRRHFVDAVEREKRLGIHRMLDPQRAVLVERGDAVLRRHIVRVRPIGRCFDEIEDRLLRRAVIP